MNNPATRQEWILEQLTERPTLSFGECFSEYLVKYSKTEQTFAKDWNKATEQHRERQQAINAAKEAAIISKEVEAAKNGLKSKHERLINLQDQAEATLNELKAGKVKETKMQGGKALSIERELTVLEKTQLRKVLKELQAEISKVVGDYAATSIDHTTKGEKIFQGFTFLGKIDEE